MEESRDLSVTIPLASSEGDIPDIDIDNIVEEDDSSSSEGTAELGQQHLMLCVANSVFGKVHTKVHTNI